MSSRVTGIVHGMGRVVGFTAAAVILPLAVALWPGYRPPALVGRGCLAAASWGKTG
jgi:hypothetical protein